MRTRRLGRAGPVVSMLGLGCMGMSDFYGPADRAESIATIHAALEHGVTLLDTGTFYGSGDNELLIAEALSGRRREDVVIAVKFGALRSPDGGFIGLDCRPVAAADALAQSLRRLRTDHVDLYQPARLDPAVPIEETVGAIARFVEKGWVRAIGLSEVSAATLRRAHAVHPIAALQIEYSLLSRGIEAEILPAARELGVAIHAYGVLSRGLLSGRWSAERSAQTRDYRAALPRFSAAHVAANLRLVDALRAIATARGVSVAQLAIAWVAAQGEDIVPLVGARTRAQLAEALPAAELALDPATLAAIAAAVPADAVLGTRYPAEQMGLLDSERPVTR